MTKSQFPPHITHNKPYLPNTMIKLTHYLKLPILLSTLLLTACASISVGYINNLAKNNNSIAGKDIAYADNKTNRLDIYKPKQSINAPVVVFFYGGCWGACQSYSKKHYRFVAQALTSNGIVAVIVDYRTYPKVLFGDIIRDTSQSVEWVKNNISRFGGDPNKIFLMGHSSGAHLAATLICDRRYLTKNTYNNIRGFVGLAGPYDFLPFTANYQKQVFAPSTNYYLSQPINFVTGNEPPMLLLYGNRDVTVERRNIINMRNKIIQLGGKVESHIYDKLSHVKLISALAIPFQNKSPVLKDILSFISRH